MSKNTERIIVSNIGEYGDYDIWKEEMLKEGFTEEELTRERFFDDQQRDWGDERMNLDKEVDGYIVAFATIGTWRGQVTGFRKVGKNIKNILHTKAEMYSFFCDRWNVRATTADHDGNTYILYRVAKDAETADRICNRIFNNDMDIDQFKRATTSLRPYVADIYGW